MNKLTKLTIKSATLLLTIDFFDWTIFLRNYFSKPMKFEYYLLQLKLFQMRPIAIFYGKPFFRFFFLNSSHTAMKDPVPNTVLGGVIGLSLIHQLHI